jgi:Fur family ferric uptake transcriptional regulator
VITDYHFFVSLVERHPEAVLRVVREAARPITADEIHEFLSETGIGIATVYRAVNKAVSEGKLARVELPNAAARFELAELPHHHHFECGFCKKVYDIHGCLPGINDLAPQGFLVQSHDILLRGTCKDCEVLAT